MVMMYRILDFIKNKASYILWMWLNHRPTVVLSDLQVILNALFFNYDLKKAVLEPRIHNQLSPNITYGESDFDPVCWQHYIKSHKSTTYFK